MADLDLAAIRARAEAATEGPWDYAGQGWVRHGDMSVGSDQIPEVLAATVLSDADGAFIAHAREDIPALLAEIDRLNATIQRVRELHSSEGRTWADFDTCADCHKAYPCPTTRALEGGEQ